MSEIKLTNSDGGSVNFNFQYENGLPIKPLIDLEYEIREDLDSEEFGLYLFIKNKDLDKLKNFEISNLYIDDEQNTLWYLINEHYIVLEEIPANIIKEVKNKKVNIYFFDENMKFIKGTRLE